MPGATQLAAVDLGTLGFALAAGLVAAFNPCGFAMLPAYLSLVVTGEAGGTPAPGERGRAVARALSATAVMAAGFVLVFGTFGLLVAPFAGAVQSYLPAATVVIGVVMAAGGAWLLAGRRLTVALPPLSALSARAGRAPTARVASMTGYGVAYAIASLSCTIGPFLAVTSATFRAGSVLGGVLAYLAYAAGMALVVGVLAVAAALAGAGVARHARRLLPHVSRVSGGLLVLVGLYVAWYGGYELRLFHGSGSADDPVVAAAGRVQQRLAGAVDAAGPWPLLALLALALSAVAVTRLRRRGDRGDVAPPVGPAARP